MAPRKPSAAKSPKSVLAARITPRMRAVRKTMKAGKLGGGVLAACLLVVRDPQADAAGFRPLQHLVEYVRRDGIVAA
jgi:hypothetical protein